MRNRKKDCLGTGKKRGKQNNLRNMKNKCEEKAKIYKSLDIRKKCRKYESKIRKEKLKKIKSGEHNNLNRKNKREKYEENQRKQKM